MFPRSEYLLPSAIALLAAILSTAVAQPVSGQISTFLDPAGDALFHAPAFQDVVRGRMKKTANGDFELLMEMAGAIPVAPSLPTPASSAIWWFWAFDLDPTASPQGYPVAPGSSGFAEFIVAVSWNGIEFAGNAIDRRPLLSGGEAIITPVLFDIHGTRIEAVLPYEQIGDVPPSFGWGTRIADWSGPVGSGGYNPVDVASAVFNP